MTRKIVENLVIGGWPAGSMAALRLQLNGGMRLATALSQAMTTNVGRSLTPIALTAIPHAMRWIAAGTRIPERALAASFASLRRAHQA